MGLHELAADHRLAFHLAAGLGPVGELEQAHVLLRLEQLERLGVEAGGEQHLDELPAELLREGAIDGPVDGDHAAVGALRVTGEGALVGDPGALARPRSRRGCCA